MDTWWYMCVYTDITIYNSYNWSRSNMGFLPNHPFYVRIFHWINPSSYWGSHILGNLHMGFSNISPFQWSFFPTCQVRVVRFYVSCLLLLSSPPLLSSSPLLLSSPPAPCRTSTTTIHAQCALPDLNHDHHRPVFPAGLNREYPRPVFPAGPQPRPSTPSVPCRTSTTTIHAQCSLPDLNREYPRPVFPAGPQPRPSTPSVPCRTSTASIHAKRYAT